MWQTIKSFLSANIAKISEAAVLALTAAGALTAVYQSGKKAERADEMKSVARDATSAKAIEDFNRARLRDGDAVKQLQDHWS